ncbi:hypothetical protein LguiB_000672 [Lonicera macranthoides]
MLFVPCTESLVHMNVCNTNEKGRRYHCLLLILIGRSYLFFLIYPSMGMWIMSPRCKCLRKGGQKQVMMRGKPC